MDNINHVTIQAKDVIDFGNQQLRDSNHEFGGAIVGKLEGTHLKVGKIIPMGTGARPGVDEFYIDEALAAETQKKVTDSDADFFGIAHTHGPKIKNREPSAEDFVTAKKTPISMLVKVDPQGGGRFEFFTGDRRNIPFTVIGMDGRTYTNNAANDVSFPNSCWGIAA